MAFCAPDNAPATAAAMAILLSNECRDIRTLLSRTPLASGRPDQPIVFVRILCGGGKRRVTGAVIGLLVTAQVRPKADTTGTPTRRACRTRIPARAAPERGLLSLRRCNADRRADSRDDRRASPRCLLPRHGEPDAWPARPAPAGDTS